jgi:hypothetical protein
MARQPIFHDLRCRQTGQNHPFAFRFLLSLVVGAGAGTDGTSPVAPSPPVAPPAAPDAPAALSTFTAGSSLRATLPPAPNSIIPIAHSLQTTKCRQGSKTTSLAFVKHTIHSLGVDAYGSTTSFGVADASLVLSEVDAEERP